MSTLMNAYQKIGKAIEVQQATMAESQHDMDMEKLKDGGPDHEVLEHLREIMDYDRAVIHGLHVAQSLIYQSAMEELEARGESV